LTAIVPAALAQEQANSSPVEACLAANRGLSLGMPLLRTAARLKSGGLLKVVAVGSSSTTGLWVLSAAATYPEVMRRELERLRPDVQFEVVNSGRVGDTIIRTLSRFPGDVLSHGPDLVVWQLGTNDLVWGGKVDGVKDKVIDGVRALKSNGADVVLMDLQYTPRVLASFDHPAMQAIIAEVARAERVGLFSRFDLMRRSLEAGVAPGALVSWDRLHNSADGYACIGKALARAIYDATR
jgi:acyl-CoA thioesterase-1